MFSGGKYGKGGEIVESNGNGIPKERIHMSLYALISRMQLFMRHRVMRVGVLCGGRCIIFGRPILLCL